MEWMKQIAVHWSMAETFQRRLTSLGIYQLNIIWSSEFQLLDNLNEKSLHNI